MVVFGLRPQAFYMVCVGIFTISSFLCGIAPSLGLLVLFRIMQGAGGERSSRSPRPLWWKASQKKNKGWHGHLWHGRGGGAHHRSHAGRLDYR